MMKRFFEFLREKSRWTLQVRSALAGARDDLMEVISHLPYNA